MLRRTGILFITVMFIRMTAGAQIATDTLHLTLDSAESLFLHQNLSLLAQKYNVDAQKALIMQAKLWPNPNFSLANGPLWHVTVPVDATFVQNNSVSAALSQLILLAGKRNKQIKLAEANAKLSEYQFFDLLRTLKYTLRTDFFNIYFLLRSEMVYNEEISSLRKVVTAFAEQQGRGYISELEVVRIKAQLYSLQSEYNDLVNQVNDLQSELKLVLQVQPTSFVDPVAIPADLNGLDPSRFSMSTLVDSAYRNRTDLQIAQANSDINKLNYNYQKALAVPDLTLSVSYDQQGSYVNNFQAVGASIDLPVLNRNQGNIKSAKAMIDYSAASEKSTKATVEGNVFRSLQKAYDNDKVYRNIDPAFYRDFDRLLHEVLANYEKRNISLLNFLDFYDSYKQNILQANSIQFNRVSAFEDLNYYTGTNFFN